MNKDDKLSAYLVQVQTTELKDPSWLVMIGWTCREMNPDWSAMSKASVYNRMGSTPVSIQIILATTDCFWKDIAMDNSKIVATSLRNIAALNLAGFKQ